MRDLDEIDRTIIRLLLEDGRRPYSDIADRVELSAPAVADRIDRLESLGVIRGFTVELDRSLLQDGRPALVELTVDPGQTAEVADSLRGDKQVEHLYQTADARVVVHTRLQADGVDGLLSAVETDHIRTIDVSPLSASDWTPQLGDATLAVDCVECGNPVTSEGQSAVIDGTRYHFCCGSCLSKFEAQFQELRDGV